MFMVLAMLVLGLSFETCVKIVRVVQHDDLSF